MSLFNVILISILAVFSYMSLLFVLAIRLKRNDIVDIAWSMGFVLISLIALALMPVYHWRRILVSGLIIIWGLRLATYLYYRNRGKQEDFRYAQWRKDWGKNWKLRSYLQVFLLQGFLMLTIAYPVFLMRGRTLAGFGVLDVLGLGLWLLGFFFQVVGDEQLRRFKKQPKNKGKLMQKGLWQYTRHPNYFGEATMWWGIFVLVLGFEQGYWAIFSPMIITFLLLRVSGVPMLERKYSENPAYQNYIRKTSGFIPLPPRK